MTKEAYLRAKKIHKELEDYQKLRGMCDYSRKNCILIKKFLAFTIYSKDEIVICDNEFTALIAEYCDKKINELEKELETL